MSIKILADENVNYKIFKELKAKGIDIVHLVDIKRGISDYEIINLASSMDAIILTEDSDFGMLAFSMKEKIKGVIYIRYKPEDYLIIANAINSVIRKYKSQLYHKFVTITSNKVRIRTL